MTDSPSQEALEAAQDNVRCTRDGNLHQVRLYFSCCGAAGRIAPWKARDLLRGPWAVSFLTARPPRDRDARLRRGVMPPITEAGSVKACKAPARAFLVCVVSETRRPVAGRRSLTAMLLDRFRAAGVVMERERIAALIRGLESHVLWEGKAT